jgi:hypothetical protein
MSATVIDALNVLTPGAQWAITDKYNYNTLEWFSTDIAQPTEQEVNDEIVRLDIQAPLTACKQQASLLLSQTDWTTIADVADPTKSNPYLLNQAEFAAYRSAVRMLAVYPVASPVWPVIPTEQWSSPA